MNTILQIPTDTTDWGPWLEELIASPQLGDVTRELTVVLGDNRVSDQREPQDILQDQYQQVLDHGFEGITFDQLRQFLLRPEALLQLQEEILINGADWVDTHLKKTTNSVELWQTIKTALAEHGLADAPTPRQPSNETQRTGRKSLPAFLSVLAMALVVGVTIWLTRPPAAPQWGFSKSGLLTAEVDREEYLESLSVAAKGWFNKTPENSEQLVTRLQQFRAGCVELLNAQHQQLPPDDRTWLLEKCQKWIDKIDGHLADLGDSTKDFQQIQGEADETINSLATALHQRSMEA